MDGYSGPCHSILNIYWWDLGTNWNVVQLVDPSVPLFVPLFVPQKSLLPTASQIVMIFTVAFRGPQSMIQLLHWHSCFSHVSTSTKTFQNLKGTLLQNISFSSLTRDLSSCAALRLKSAHMMSHDLPGPWKLPEHIHAFKEISQFLAIQAIIFYWGIRGPQAINSLDFGDLTFPLTTS